MRISDLANALYLPLGVLVGLAFTFSWGWKGYLAGVSGAIGMLAIVVLRVLVCVWYHKKSGMPLSTILSNG